MPMQSWSGCGPMLRNLRSVQSWSAHASDKEWEGEASSLLPVLVPADLSSWMEERQSDLQVALGSADSARVVEVTTKLAEGARRLADIMST